LMSLSDVLIPFIMQENFLLHHLFGAYQDGY
jgi:hypothetical protein